MNAGGWTAQADEVKAFRSENSFVVASDSPSQLPNLRALSLDTAGTEATEGAIFWNRGGQCRYSPHFRESGLSPNCGWARSSQGAVLASHGANRRTSTSKTGT